MITFGILLALLWQGLAPSFGTSARPFNDILFERTGGAQYDDAGDSRAVGAEPTLGLSEALSEEIY